MTEILEAEAHISDSEKKKKCRKQTATRKGKSKEVNPELDVNSEFVGSSSEGSTSSDESECEILNEEVRKVILLFMYKT
jgi:hypothetical protein